MKVYEFLEKNMDVIQTLVRAGAVPTSYINYFQIYCVYQSTKNLKSKMSRYYFTSDVMKTSTLTVQKAVKAMETVIKN